MKQFKLLTLLGLSSVLAGCNCTNAQFAAYVAAHRAKYDQTAPLFKDLVEKNMPEDTDFQKATKESKLKLIEAEGKMIEEAEVFLRGPK